MQTAHHPHRRMHTFSGLPYSYNLNLASAAPPLCHSYPFLTYNAASEVLNNHGDYYHAMKSTSSTADKSDSISSSTDDEEIDNENSPVSNHSPSHPLRDVKHTYPSTVVGYPTLPAECAAMIPAINCHRPQKRYFSQENNSHRKNVYSKPFTIEAILGLENRMLFTNNSGHSNNTNTSFSENAKIVYSPEKKSSDKHFPTNRSGKEFRRNLNTKLTDKVAKSKRVRTIFTPEQLERLENEFERQQYMVGPERLYLASSLNLTEAQVKVWFQNRRIKWRKQHLEHQQAQLAKIRENDDQETNNYHHVSRQSDEIMPFADDPNTPTTEDEEDRMLT